MRILPPESRWIHANGVDRSFNRESQIPSVDSMTTTATEASRHFAAKLSFETDPFDVRAAQQAGERFVLIDSRGAEAWRQGRIVGAVHLPTAEIGERALETIPLDVPVVTYCWGPGCNGSTRAALALSLLGYEVREMIGGFEYWAREGLPVEDDNGPVDRAADPLTAPVGAVSCAC